MQIVTQFIIRQRSVILPLQRLGKADDESHRVLKVVGHGVGEGVQFLIARFQFGRVLAQHLLRPPAFGDLLLCLLVEPGVLDGHSRLVGEDGQQVQVIGSKGVVSGDVVQCQSADGSASDDEGDTKGGFLLVHFRQVNGLGARVGLDVTNDERLLMSEDPTGVPFARLEASRGNGRRAEANTGPHRQFFLTFIQEMQRPLFGRTDGGYGDLDNPAQYLVEFQGGGDIPADPQQRVHFPQAALAFLVKPGVLDDGRQVAGQDRDEMEILLAEGSQAAALQVKRADDPLADLQRHA